MSPPCPEDHPYLYRESSQGVGEGREAKRRSAANFDGQQKLESNRELVLYLFRSCYLSLSIRELYGELIISYPKCL